MVATETEPVRLFDANAYLGRAAAHQPGAYTDLAGLRAAMEAYGLDEVLVYHAAAVRGDVAAANRRLLQEIRDEPRVHAAWVLLPPCTGEMSEPQALVEELLAGGVRAARLFPRAHGYRLRLRNLAELLEPLARRHVPVFLDYGIVHWSDRAIDWDGVDEVCGALPELPLILVRAGLGLDRDLYPLLARHGNLYLETSYYFGHQGLGTLAARFGAGRLIFGTGMPLFAPGAAIGALAHSGLDAAVMAQVGAGNLSRLLGGVG